MKIRISTISPKGLEIHEQMSLERLNGRMNEGRHNEILFTRSPLVDVTVLRTASGAETRGTVKAWFRQPCSRCIEPVNRELDIPANFVLQPIPEGEQRDSGKYEDDVGIVWYEGDHVDLESVIQEALILSLTIYWHPPCDESGKCTVCGLALDSEGENERTTNNLGALLKRAGIN